LGALANFARVVHIVILGWWMGAYAELVQLGRVAEAVLGSQHETGAVLLAALADLERFGIWGLPILLVTLWVGWSSFGRKRRGPAVGLGILAVLTLGSRYVVRPRFREIRDGLGRPVEDLGLTDPALVDYLWWERTLAVVVSMQIGVALVLLVWAVIRNRPKTSLGIEL